MKRYWRIQVHDSACLIFEERVPVGCLTDGRLKEMLKSLAAIGLDPEEIVGSYVNKSTRMSNNILRVTKDSGKILAYYCGESYYATAVVVDEVDKPVEYQSVRDG